VLSIFTNSSEESESKEAAPSSNQGLCPQRILHRERRRLCKAYYKTPGQGSKSRLLQIEKEENIAKRDPTESFPVAAAEDVNR